MIGEAWIHQITVDGEEVPPNVIEAILGSNFLVQRVPYCVTHRDLIVYRTALIPYCSRMEWAGECDIVERWMECEKEEEEDNGKGTQ